MKKASNKVEKTAPAGCKQGRTNVLQLRNKETWAPLLVSNGEEVISHRLEIATRIPGRGEGNGLQNHGHGEKMELNHTLQLCIVLEVGVEGEEFSQSTRPNVRYITKVTKLKKIVLLLKGKIILILGNTNISASSRLLDVKN
ncbi:hypothetical protein KIL84_020614 [Mauremys mutica]|uniref:Uncharacterized protein n=1 Tax=Mauremys mutica TaxID=74926 RepID=A0A9D3XZ12_9SAUR|nr:hypothetical protein KIL84_020614 [Mauremys mutica]